MGNKNELVRLSAAEVVKQLRAGGISPVEIVEAVLKRIQETDDKVNALPTVCAERARAEARRLTDNPPEKSDPFWKLAGLPVAIKDLNEVKGVRTTYGSPLYRDYRPDYSDLTVETLEKNGAIVIGKTNTPEFGAGGNTFNEVFGATKNPWDLSKTCGGSSGGSGAALASRQVHLASGSDLGGSLRMPASFCSVVGLRPSPGRVAQGPSELPFNDLPVNGPMARDVTDLALMLDAMTGQHPRDPLSLPVTDCYQDAARKMTKPRRVAFSPNLGVSPVVPEIEEITRKAALTWEEQGVEVVETHPDFQNAQRAFHILRSYLFAAKFAMLIQERRDEFKPEIIWNVEQAFKISSKDLAWAEQERGALYYRMVDFFKEYDLLLTPTTVVPPFNFDQRYVTKVNGHEFDNYVDWFTITYVVTLTSLPVLSLPCGFTGTRLPVGLQIIGKPRGEADLLSMGSNLEELLGIRDKCPPGF